MKIKERLMIRALKSTKVVLKILPREDLSISKVLNEQGLTELANSISVEI